jgi:hypothetical protein
MPIDPYFRHRKRLVYSDLPVAQRAALALLMHCFRQILKLCLGVNSMFWRKWITKSAGLALMALLIPALAVAQERATIQATATVVSSLTVVGSNNLRFGSVTPGVNKSVDKATIGFAGEWEVTGTSSAELTIGFTLPDSLRTVDSVAAMRISFSSTDASYDDGTGGGQTAPAGILNPNGPATRRLGASGQMILWIGGMVHPSISQTGGDYAADVLLTVAYTGS